MPLFAVSDFWSLRQQFLTDISRLAVAPQVAEEAVSGAYDIEGLETVGQIRRLIEGAVVDTLSQENSIARSRTLAYLAQVGLSLLEKGNLDERLRALEDSVRRKPRG